MFSSFKVTRLSLIINALEQAYEQAKKAQQVDMESKMLARKSVKDQLKDVDDVEESESEEEKEEEEDDEDPFDD